VHCSCILPRQNQLKSISHQLKSQVSGGNVQQKWISLVSIYACVVLSYIFDPQDHE